MLIKDKVRKEVTPKRVFSVLISILILFILPLYITFEKIDDIVL